MKRLLTFFSFLLLFAFSMQAQRFLKHTPIAAEKLNKKGVAAMDQDGPMIPAAPATAIGYRAAEEIAIGTSYNLFTVLLDGQNQVCYNPDLNAITFAHRQNAGAAGGSGIVSYDLSLDGGKTWDATDHKVTPSLTIATGQQSNGNRYPSGTIWNPAGNTDPANAKFVAVGPSLHNDPVYGNGWGYEFVGSSDLEYDANSVVEKYYTNADTTAFHPYGLMTNPDGSIWYVSTTWNTDADPDAVTAASYGTFYICKLTYNTTTGGFDREVKQVIQPNWGMLGDNQWQIQGDYNLSFSPDGETGYFVFVTTDLDNENVGDGIGVKPVIWKSTDGGDTWTKYANVDYQSMSELMDWTLFSDANGNGTSDDTTGIRLPYMQSIDVTVDKNDDLHIFAHMFSRSTNTLDSMGFGYFSGDSISTLFHFITDGTDWDAKYVDTYGNSNGTFSTVAVSSRPQASRTPDGSEVFFTYLQSLDVNTGYTTFLDTNDSPDVFGAGYSVDTETSYKKWLTDPFINEELALTGKYFYSTLSPITIKDGGEKYFELPLVAANPGLTDSDPPQFYYVYGIGFDAADLGLVDNTKDVLSAESVSMEVVPNPASTFAQVNYELAGGGKTSVSVFNMQGNLVKQFDNGIQQAGKHSLIINAGAFTSGIYIVSLQTENGVATQKLVVR